VSRKARFPAPTATDPYARAAAVTAAGFAGPLERGRTRELTEILDRDPDPRGRVAALGALVRSGSVRAGERAWRRGAADDEASVRRRAAELAPALAHPRLTPLLALTTDPDWSVAETAAWAVGEIAWTAANRRRAARSLARLATDHEDPLVREASVAALGALGDPVGLPAVLHATRDRPTIRRRAVLALAPFEGPEVDAALHAALDDPDWQTRQSAEDLL
jgi:HEAT repeat protein